MAVRTPTQCDQCGKLDTAPKVHIGDITKHHDCLSVSEEAMVKDSSEVAAGIIDTCKSGVRNDALLSHIEQIHAEGV